jgi:hypothetical protein
MGFAGTRHLRQTAPVPRLGLRARWRAVQEKRMISPRARQRLAERIERAIERAGRSEGGLSAVVPVCRPAVQEARGTLLDLAERLRAPRAVNPDGVWATRTLLIDGGGPLYVPGEPGELKTAAMRALMTLDAHGPRR